MSPARTLLRALALRRRSLAAACAAAAAVLVLPSLVTAPSSRLVPVIAASRDLASGTALSMADLTTVMLPAAAIPAGVLRPGAAVLGRALVGPVRRGEALTDARLLGPSLLAALGPQARGLVATAVRLDDAGAAGLLRTGDRVDVLAADDEAQPPTAVVVASGALVLSTPPADARTREAPLVVLAVSPDAARALAAAAGRRLSVVLRG